MWYVSCIKYFCLMSARTIPGPILRGTYRYVLLLLWATTCLGAEWYAAPNGLPTNSGTSTNSPWDIYTAFTKTSSIQPGDTIFPDIKITYSVNDQNQTFDAGTHSTQVLSGNGESLYPYYSISCD